MTTTDPDKTDPQRRIREIHTELVSQDYQINALRAAAFGALAIPVGLAICVYFGHAAARDARQAETVVTLTGDCENARIQPGPDRRGATVILPPGCHYKDNF
ncbi:MAG TPA: hypothetical protein VL625_11165 [Patescibacteria group bacterium]|nr:hypothetical protein [Patescibacteria group bacterium]